MKTKQFITSTLTLFTTTVLCFLLLKSTVAEAQTTSTATPVLVSQVTDYLLPEDFRVYVSPSGAIVNWPAPGYIEKFYPPLTSTYYEMVVILLVIPAINKEVFILLVVEFM